MSATVEFPDGTTVRATPLRERVESDPERDFGLYADPGWAPTWPSDMIDWPDFGWPTDASKAATQIHDAFERARSGQRVEVGCIGALGRTGTILACMATLAGVDPNDAETWVHEHYNADAIEPGQPEWIAVFADRARAAGWLSSGRQA